MGSHRSELFSLTLADWADLVIVMSPGQKADVAHDFSVSKNRILILADLDPNLPFRRTIPDPLGLPRHAFADSFDQIDRSLHQLIGIMRGSP
jgi:protein-tyrosine-phosphatase